MHNNGGASGADNIDSTDMQVNSMRHLTQAHRDNFINFIDSLKPLNGTPTHKVMTQAHNYMSKPADNFINKNTAHGPISLANRMHHF